MSHLQGPSGSLRLNSARATHPGAEAASAHELEHREKSEQLNRLKAAILKGVDPSLFVEELKQLQARLQILEKELSPAAAPLSAHGQCSAA
jgi:hypothetical protein